MNGKILRDMSISQEGLVMNVQFLVLIFNIIVELHLISHVLVGLFDFKIDLICPMNLIYNMIIQMVGNYVVGFFQNMRKVSINLKLFDFIFSLQQNYTLGVVLVYIFLQNLLFHYVVFAQSIFLLFFGIDSFLSANFYIILQRINFSIIFVYINVESFDFYLSFFLLCKFFWRRLGRAA